MFGKDKDKQKKKKEKMNGKDRTFGGKLQCSL